ncbi:L-allo-threonine aldolase-like isoform X2 [Anser cygnoides]|uniref:L-allo-threonine aldolase-like isoform X2 n=1 Tax=Anser cygnoides TaxID=8845 RepID=UPI0034D27B5B
MLAVRGAGAALRRAWLRGAGPRRGSTTNGDTGAGGDAWPARGGAALGCVQAAGGRLGVAAGLSTAWVGCAGPSQSRCPQHVVDLRSDTVTQPSEAMRRAMAQAAVGDDDYGEDPTVNELQHLAARFLGMEEALFVPTATMANLIAGDVLLQSGAAAGTGAAGPRASPAEPAPPCSGCPRPRRALTAPLCPSDVPLPAPGGSAAPGRRGAPARLRARRGGAGGRGALPGAAGPARRHLRPGAAGAGRPRGPRQPVPSPPRAHLPGEHAQLGGGPGAAPRLPPAGGSRRRAARRGSRRGWRQQLPVAPAAPGGTGGSSVPAQVHRLAERYGLRVHMDGARLMNAAVAQAVEPAQITQHCDSVSLCFSKGLGAPAGAVLAGRRAFVAEAWRVRKLLGGGMRQAGVLAAAARVGLEQAEATLRRDHSNARRFARGIQELKSPLCSVSLPAVETNMVMVAVTGGWPSPAELCTYMRAVSKEELAETGHAVSVLLFPWSAHTLRAVWHRDVSAHDTELALNKLGFVARKCQERLALGLGPGPPSAAGH